MRRSLRCASLLLALLVVPAWGDEASPPHSVRDTGAARQAIDQAQRAFAAGETRRGLEVLQRVLDGLRDDLIEVGGEDAAVQVLYLPAPEAARRMILALPEEGRRAYEELSGPAARELVERATLARDEALLHEAIVRYGLTRAGVEAARRLAESALERGAPFDAVSALRSGLRGAPQDVGLWWRLVDAHAAAGDASGLAALELPASLPPAASPTGPLSLPARRETALAALAAAPPPPEALGWGGGPAHDGRDPWDHVLRPLRWSAGAPPPWRRRNEATVFGMGVGQDGQAVFEERFRLLAPYFPLVLGTRLVVADGLSVAAYDLLSGRAEWRFPAPGRAPRGLELLSPRGEALDGRTNVEVAFAPSAAAGLVFTTVEVADPTYAARYLNTVETTTYRPRRTLIALDADTGALRWRMGEDPADRRALGDLSIGGPAVAAQDLVVAVGVGFDKRWRSTLLAFDARTGRLRWMRELVTSQQELNLFGEPVKELWAGAPAVLDGTVYAPTGLGVLAAADLRTGELRWLSSYPASEIERVELWYATPIRLPTWGPSPVVAHGTSVLVAPADSPFLLCFDRTDGRLRWRERSEATRDTLAVDQFLGVAHDGRREVALVTGRNLRALDLVTGAPAWGAKLFGRGSGRGRGALSKSRVYVPSTEGLEIFSIPGQGRLVPPGFLPWPEGAQAGNVVSSDKVLVVAGGAGPEGPDGRVQPIQAFFDPEDIERGIAARRREAPQDPTFALEAADLWRLVGQDVKAESLYDEARRLAQRAGDAVVAERAREGVHLLWRDRGDAAAAADRPSDARSSYEAALARAATAAERVAVRLRLDRLLRARGLETTRVKNLEALAEEAGSERAVLNSADGEVEVRAATRLLLASIHREAGRPAAAIDELQRLLREDATTILHGETAGEAGARLVAEILATTGPAPYRRYEEEAAARLRNASQGTDPAPFEQLLREFPNSRSVRDALLGLAERQAAAGSHLEAATTLRRFLTSWPEHPQAAQALASLVVALEASGSREPARAAAGTLERRFATARVRVGGVETTGAQFARDLRARLGMPPPPPPAAPLSRHLEDRFAAPVESGRGVARCLEIDGATSTSATLPVLIDAGEELVALDPVAARERWRKPWAGVGRAAAVGDVLAVGTRTTVVALDPSNGEERWTRELSGDVLDVRASLGQVVVLVRTPGVLARTRLVALDPVTSVVAWDRELHGETPERFVASDDGIVVLRRRTVPSGMAWQLSILSPLSGDAVAEIAAPADAWTEGAPRLVQGGAVLFVTREPEGAELRAVDLATGRTRWSRPLAKGRSFARRHLFVRGDAAVLVEGSGAVLTIGLEDGASRAETAITGGIDAISDRCVALVGDRVVAVTRVRRNTQALSAFDLATGRAAWSVPLTQVSQGLLLPAGDTVVAVLSPQLVSMGRGRVEQPPEYQILVTDVAEGRDVVRITPRGIGAHPPSAMLAEGALVVAGQRAFAIYR